MIRRSSRPVRLLLCGFSLFAVPGNGQKQVVRWAGAGGGWRSMAQDMGLANIFAQAGLFQDDNDLNSDNILTAMSAQSGGAWFATQFFYSEEFYNTTTKSTPAELSLFVNEWMISYRDYTASFPQGPLDDSLECNLLELINTGLDMRIVRMLVDNCALFVALHGNWADFIEGMLATAASGYGDDSLVSRAMTAENRVPALQSTDVGIQMALVANTRIRTANNRDNDQVVSIGHEQDDTYYSMYSTPLGIQWFVSGDDASYISNTRDGTSFPTGLVTHRRETPKEFTFSDWQDYFLYPSDNAVTLVDVPFDGISENESTLSSLRTPFDGVPPTVTQMAASSSAVVGFFSGLAPSTFAQSLSLAGHTLTAILGEDAELLNVIAQHALGSIADMFYKSSFFDETAVCSQWPAQECDERDGRFVDGYATDSPTAALNIGHYQSKAGYHNSDATIKLILTPGNIYGELEDPVHLLNYFNTTFNQGVEPGEFLWPSDQFIVPLRSPQIFHDYLDKDMLDSMWEPVAGLDHVLKSARIQTTTLENEAFHVQPGTRVDILILQLMSDIPTEILGVDEIDSWKGPLADLAEGIASSSDLLGLVQDFVLSD